MKTKKQNKQAAHITIGPTLEFRRKVTRPDPAKLVNMTVTRIVLPHGTTVTIEDVSHESFTVTNNAGAAGQ